MIPKNYEEWLRCITVDCGIKITKEFVTQRLAVYGDKNNKETQEFIRLYGENHRENVERWLMKCTLDNFKTN